MIGPTQDADTVLTLFCNALAIGVFALIIACHLIEKQAIKRGITKKKNMALRNVKQLKRLQIDK